MSRSFESLRDVRKGDGEGLEGCEWVLEVQRVGVSVDASELHHLYSHQAADNLSGGKNIFFWEICLTCFPLNSI